MAQTDRNSGLVGETGIKEPVVSATTANIALSGEQTIDGVSCIDGNRVLVKDQTTAANNGIYEVDTGTWSRTKDCDGAYDLVQGSLVYVYNGTTNGNKIFKCTTANTITIGTSSLAFTAMDIELTGVARVVWCGTATGTANALTLTPSTAVSSLTSGLTLLFKTGAAGNSGAVTIAVSGLTATTAQLNGAAMVSGDLQASLWYMAIYDGTNFQISKIGIPATIHGATFDNDITMSGASIIEAEGAAVASAATTEIWATDGNTRHITGVTTITSLGTASQAGQWQKIIFDGILTLTHGANLNLPGSANITTAADDFAWVYADTTTQHDVLYFKKDGTAVVGTAPTLQAFTASGTWTKPASLTCVIIEVIGAGASGGASLNGAGGGGGGGYSLKRVAAASLGATETVTVGAGGAAVASGSAGNSGGTTSFGAHCSATGGAGALGSDNSFGGLGGAGTGGDLNMVGCPGRRREASDATGHGGAAARGGGGGLESAGAGGAGQNYGGGGAGGANANSGAGAGGSVTVTEFY